MVTQNYDVIVIGGGIVGASTAHSLTKQGERVLLLDQYTPGHKQGSSHGDGRVVRFNYTEAIYVEMAMKAYDAWDTLSEEAGTTLLLETGLLEYGPANHEAIRVTETILSQYNIDYERLSVEQARERFPQYHFDEDSDVLYQPRGGVARATPAVEALWRLISANGGTTLSGQRVQSITAHSELVTITLENSEQISAERAVLTTGGWTAKLAQQLGVEIPLEVTQEILAYFPPQADTTVNHHIGAMPVMIDYYTVEGRDEPFYSLPIVDIAGVKMGWHHSGIVIDADDARQVVEPIVAEIKRWCERRYPHLQTETIDIQTCLYTNTPDYHFVLDTHPQYPNVVIGAGFSGHGFKFGPLLGEVLASLSRGETPSIALDTFKLARFANPETLDKRLGA
ncbi:MAG: N-methyl-L-tryptophan oxidase [Anaerolineae bacterium]